MAISFEEFEKQYNAARSQGMSREDAIGQIRNSYTQPTQQQAEYWQPQQQQQQRQWQPQQMSYDDFSKEYNLARSSGLSKEDAISQIKSGKRFSDEARAAMEQQWADSYKGKTTLGRAVTRIGATLGAGFSDVASGLTTSVAKLGTGLQNTLANIPIDEREQAVYQLARGQYWRSHDYSGNGKSSITQAEFDALDPRGKKYLQQRFRINTVEDFNKYLAQAYKDISDANKVAGIGEQQMQQTMEATAPMRDWATEQREKAKFGLNDSFGGKTASFLLDTISSAPGMAADAAFAAATGGSGLILMAGRVFGNAYNNARAKGIGDDKAGIYGLASAALETATEMIGGEALLNKFAYGNKGLLNNAIENTVAKLSGKPVAQFLAQYAMGAGSEAIEEVMSQAGEPFIEAILSDDYGKALVENYGEQTVKDYLLAGLGGALMAIGGNVVTDVGAGTVNTIRGAEGPRTATGQQLAEINAKHGIEQSPEATAAYQKAVDEGKSEGEAMVAGQTAKYQSDKQAENYKILNDYILGVNENKELAQRGKDDFVMVAPYFAQAKGNSVLIDKNGDEVGRVVYKGGDGFVVRLANGKKEPVFTNGISGSIDRATETYKALTNGGQFQDANIFEAVQERQAQQKMASQQEVAPETPANPAPAQQATQPEQPAPQPTPQQAQREYKPGETTESAYRGMPVKVMPRADGKWITVSVAKTGAKGNYLKGQYKSIGSAKTIDEANRMIADYYAKTRSGQAAIVNNATGKSQEAPSQAYSETSKTASESPKTTRKSDNTSNKETAQKASTEQSQELNSKPKAKQQTRSKEEDKKLRAQLGKQYGEAVRSNDVDKMIAVRDEIVNAFPEEADEPGSAVYDALETLNDYILEAWGKPNGGKRYMADLDSTANELDGLSRGELQKELTKARVKLDKLMASARKYRNNGRDSAFQKEYSELSGLISDIQSRMRELDETDREQKYPERGPSEYSKKENKGLYREAGTRESIEYEGREVITLTGKQLQSIDGDGKEIFDKKVHDYFDREKTLTPDQVDKMKPVQILQRLADWANDLRPLGRLSGFAKWYTDISSREDIDKGALGNLQQKFSDNVAEGEEDVDDSAYSFGSRGVEKQSIAAQAAAQKENKTFAAMWLYSSLQDFAHANTFGYGNTNLLDACDWLIEQHGKGRFDKKSAHRWLLDHVEKLVGKNVTDWSKASVQDALRLIGEKYPAIVEATEEEAFSLLPDDAKIEIDALLARAKTITLASDEEKAEIANDIAIDPDNPEAGLDEYERYRKKHGREAKTLFSVLDGNEAYSKDKTLQSRSEFDYWDEDMSDNEQEAGTEQLSLEQEEAIEDAIYEALKQRKGWLNESQFKHGELPYSTTMLLKEGSKADVGTDTMFNGDKASHDNFEGMKDRRGNQWVLKRGTGILRNLFRSNIAETLTAVYNEHQQTLRDMKRELREKVAKRDDLRRRYKGAEDLQGMSLPLKNVDAGKELSKEIKELEKQIDAEQKLLDRFDNKDYKKAQKVIEDLKKNGADKKTIDAAKKEAADVNYTLSRLYRDSAMTEKNIQDILNSLKGQEKEVGGFQIANLKDGMNARLAGEAINKALEESNEQERRRNPETYTGALPGTGSNRPFLAGSDWQRARAEEESDEHRAARKAADAEAAERLGKDEIWFEEQQQRSSRFRAATEEQEQRTRYQNGEALSSGNTNGANRNDGRNDAAVSGEPGRAGQEVGGAGKKLSPKKEAARKRNQAFADKINGAPEIKGFPMDARPGKAGKVSTVKDMGDHIYIEGEATAGITADDKKYSKTANTINNAFDEWGIAVAGVNGKIFKRRGAVQSIAGIFVPTANSVGRTTPIGGFVEGNSVCLRNISRGTVNKTVRGARHEIQHKITDHMFPGEKHNDQMVEFAKKLVTDVGLDYDEATTKLRTVYEDLGITDEVLIADEVIARIADAEGFGTDADPRTPTEGAGKAYVTPEQADAMYSALINSTEWRSAVFNRSNTANTRALFFEDIPNSFYDISSEQSSTNRNYRLEKYTQLIEESIDARANGNADKADSLLNQARRLFSENVNHGWQLVQKEHKAELDRLVSEIERLAKTPRDIAATGEELDKLLSDIRELASNPRPSGYENLKSKYASEIKHGTARKGNEGLKNEPVYRVETGENLSKYETTSGVSSGERLGVGKRFMADLEVGEGVPWADRMADWSNGSIPSEEWQAMYDEFNEVYEGRDEPSIQPARKYVDEDTWEKGWDEAAAEGKTQSNPFIRKKKGETEATPYGNIADSHNTINRIANKSIFKNTSTVSRVLGDAMLGKRTAEHFREMNALVNKVITGEKNVTALYHMLQNFRNTPGMSQFIDEKALELFQRAAATEQPAYDEDHQITSGAAASLFMYNTDKAFAYLAARANRVMRIEYQAKLALNKAAKANGKGPAKNLAQTVLKTLNSLQMSGGNFWRMMDNFDKDADGEGYSFQRQHDLANSTKITTTAQAQGFLEDAKNTKGFKEFANGTAKGKYASLLSEVSLLKSLDTLYREYTAEDKKTGKEKTISDWGKVIGRDHFTVTDADGKTTTIKIEGESKKERAAFIQQLHDDLKADIDGNDAAREYVKGIEDMFEYLSPLLRKTSANLGFVRKMSEKRKYFPLSNADFDSDSKSDIGWSLEDEMGVGIAGFGHMKTRYSDTYNLQIMPVSQVVDSYIQQATNYIAYAEFGADLKLLLDDSGVNGNFGETVEKQFGEPYARWLKNYTRDMNMIKAEDPTGFNKLFANARTKMMQGALLGSVSVPIKQTASYWSAMGVVDPRALARAWRGPLRAGKKVSGAIDNLFFKSRGQGSFDPDVSQSIATGWVNKLRNSGKWGAAIVNATNHMDSRTVANVYLACCYDIEANSGLKPSEIYENGKNLEGGLKPAGELLVNAKFAQAVLNTQPIFTKQARAELARTNSELLKMFSTFRTQQTQNYNRILTTLNEYNAAKKHGKEKSQAALTELKQTVAGQIAAAASISALTMISDILLHKHKKYKKDKDDTPYNTEDDKFDAGTVLGTLAMKTLEAMGGTTLFGNELAQILIDKVTNGKTNEFYGVSAGAISSLKGCIDAWNWLKADFEQNDGDPKYFASNAKTFINRTATMLGIPAQNAFNIMNSFYQWTGDIVLGKDPISGYDARKYEDFMKEFDAVGRDYGNKLYNAVKANNKAKADEAVEKMGDEFESTIWYTCLNHLKSGDLDDDDVFNILTNYSGKSESDARYAIKTMHLNMDTGYSSTTSDSEKSAKTAYLNGKLSRDEYKDLLMEYGSKSSDQADKYIDKIDFVRETGYEENKYSQSDLDDTYASSEKMGLVSFYEKYGSQFGSPEDFGDVFNYLNNSGRSDFPTYKSQKGGYTASATQSKRITLLNELIQKKKITYQQARLIWTENFGYKTSAYSQWHNVKAA